MTPARPPAFIQINDNVWVNPTNIASVEVTEHGTSWPDVCYVEVRIVGDTRVHRVDLGGAGSWPTPEAARDAARQVMWGAPGHGS